MSTDEWLHQVQPFFNIQYPHYGEIDQTSKIGICESLPVYGSTTYPFAYVMTYAALDILPVQCRNSNRRLKSMSLKILMDYK